MATSTSQWDGANYKAADAVQRKNPGSLWFAFNDIGRAYLLVNPGGINILADNPVTAGADPLAAAGGALNAMKATGAHGYPTLEQAVQQGNTSGGAVQAIITACDAAASSPAGGGVVGVIETVNAPHSTAPTGSGDPNTPTGDASTPQNPTTAAASPLSWLTGNGSSLVYRGVCIVGGLALLYLGFNRMTGGKIQQAVTGTAKTAATAAAL